MLYSAKYYILFTDPRLKIEGGGHIFFGRGGGVLSICPCISNLGVITFELED